MLKKLRIKFIIVIMTITSLMLGSIFGILYFSTKSNLERESMQMMGSLAMSPMKMPPISNSAKDVYLPYFTILLNKSGEISEIHSDFFDLSDEEILANLVELTYGKDSMTGVLKDYKLRYFCVDNPMGYSIVFADITNEMSTLHNLIKTLAIIGVISFIAFLGISILLARWAVKPVERAWTQQKQFIADASHELKTPLTVIMTDAELLHGLQCSEKDRLQLSDNISTMSKQMRGLLEGMLELARIDSGAVKRVMDNVLFSETVSNSSMIFEPLFFEKDLLFTYEVAPEITVLGNEGQLKQLVDILLDNAGKYASAFGEIRLSLKESAHKHCLLTVANQGEQIDPEELSHLFERFYRVDKARTRNQSYGLGLSIAQSIVEEHHGKIWVESKDGFNTFFVELTMI